MAADRGDVPPFLNLEELAELAQARMAKMHFDYFYAGAETQQALTDNRSCFGSYRILPRILVDVSRVDTSTTMLGEPMRALGRCPGSAGSRRSMPPRACHGACAAAAPCFMQATRWRCR